MTSKTNWSRDQVVKLLELVEENECLWNVESSEYHNQNKRRTALTEIAGTVGMVYEEVKKKLHTLRAQYSKERTKMKTVKSGSGSDETYKTKWEYFEMMQFMFRHTGRSQTVDSIAGVIGNNQMDELQESEYQQNLSEDQTPVESPSQLSQHPLSPAQSPLTPDSDIQPAPIKKQKKKNQSSIDFQEQAAINRCISVLSQANSKDEYSIFGEYVASELRLLKAVPDLQIKLKNSIKKNILEVTCEYAASSQQSSPAASLPPAQHTSSENSRQFFEELAGPSYIYLQIPPAPEKQLEEFQD